MWRQWTLWRAVYTTVVAALVGLSHAQHHILPDGGEIKAVLVAAARHWENYASQADVCHAYQILRQNGIPKNNIIVLMYDDIAYNEKNPTKGVLINRPHGPDVYKNCTADYTKENVTKRVYFDVLLGNKDAVKGKGSGRVLESGANDTVFIFHVGHGSIGALQMLDDEIIMVKELWDVLKEMANSSRFHKMFFYLEACRSGSMFESFPSDLNILSLTSSSPTKDSRKCFCNFTKDFYCVGSEFDYFWMRDAETVDLRQETVQQQFKKVKSLMFFSHPHEYGDLRLSSTKMSEVLGFRENLLPSYDDKCEDPLVPHQIPVVALEHLIRAAKDPEEKKKYENKLQDLQQSRDEMAQFFSKLAEEVLPLNNMDLYEHTISNTNAKLTKTNLDCYENAVTQLHDNCFKISMDPFVNTQLHVLINLCNLVPEARLVEAMQSVCHRYPVHQVVLDI